MPMVMTEIPEASNGQVARLGEKRSLIELPAAAQLRDRLRLARDESEVRKPDLAAHHRLDALRHAINPFTDGNPVGRRATGHMAVQPHPVDRRHASIDVVLIGLREGSRHLGELEVEQVPPPCNLSQTRSQLVTRHWRWLGAEALDFGNE